MQSGPSRIPHGESVGHSPQHRLRPSAPNAPPHVIEITEQLGNRRRRRLLETQRLRSERQPSRRTAAKHGSPQPPHPTATAPPSPTTPNPKPGSPSAPTAPTSPPTTAATGARSDPDPKFNDTPDADQHWNALSLPYAVGPHGRIGTLRASALKSNQTPPTR